MRTLWISVVVTSLLLAGCSSGPAPQATPSPTPESVSGSAEYLETARSHFQAGRFDEAATNALLARDLAQAENAPETVARARFLLARAYQKKGESSKALAEYGALKKSTLDDETRKAVHSALAQYRQQALEKLNQARQTFAKKAYRNALWQGKAALAMLEAGAGDPKQIAQAKGLVGRCHAKLGESAEARKFLQEALAASPTDSELKKALAATAPRVSSAPDAPGEEEPLESGAPDVNRARDYARTRLPQQHNVPIPNAPTGLNPVAPVTW